jgi:hypothetical protein
MSWKGWFARGASGAWGSPAAARRRLRELGFRWAGGLARTTRERASLLGAGGSIRHAQLATGTSGARCSSAADNGDRDGAQALARGRTVPAFYIRARGGWVFLAHQDRGVRVWAVARLSTARYGQRRATASEPMAARRCRCPTRSAPMGPIARGPTGTGRSRRVGQREPRWRVGAHARCRTRRHARGRGRLNLKFA